MSTLVGYRFMGRRIDTADLIDAQGIADLLGSLSGTPSAGIRSDIPTCPGPSSTLVGVAARCGCVPRSRSGLVERAESTSEESASGELPIR